MDDIVAFLTRCLDEDQQLAEAAASVDPAPWTAATDDERDNDQRSGHGFGVVVAADEVALWDCEGSSTLCMTASTARFVAANDPARVLADIAAKRKLLDTAQRLYADAADLAKDANPEWITLHGIANAITQALAALYAARPGYNPAWKVDD